MGSSSKRWTVQDRWQHIIDTTNHPEMADYEEYLRITISKGRRKQEPLNARKYRYYLSFDDLPDQVNHVVAIVLFGLDLDEQGKAIPYNYVATAFFKHIRVKG
jgi:hypothetical protein